MLLAELIKDYRTKKSLTGKQMAVKLKVDYHAYWRFEQGRSIDQKHFLALVRWILTT